MATQFDIYKQDGTAVVTGQESPVTVTGLTPATTYSGWYVTLAGETGKTIIPDFTTKAAPTTTTTTTIIVDPTTTTTTVAPTTTTTTVAPTTTTTTTTIEA